MQKSVEFFNTIMQIPVFIRKTIEVIIDQKVCSQYIHH